MSAEEVEPRARYAKLWDYRIRTGKENQSQVVSVAYGSGTEVRRRDCDRGCPGRTVSVLEYSGSSVKAVNVRIWRSAFGSARVVGVPARCSL